MSYKYRTIEVSVKLPMANILTVYLVSRLSPATGTWAHGPHGGRQRPRSGSPRNEPLLLFLMKPFKKEGLLVVAARQVEKQLM